MLYLAFRGFESNQFDTPNACCVLPKSLQIVSIKDGGGEG